MNDQVKVENRGGSRPGAGRKPGIGATLSANQIAKMLRTARKWAKRHKKTIDDVLLSIVYDETAKNSDRMTGIKVFKEYTTAKITEGSETDKNLGPAVFLPEQRPTLEVVKTEKAA